MKNGCKIPYFLWLWWSLENWKHLLERSSLNMFCQNNFFFIFFVKYISHFMHILFCILFSIQETLLYHWAVLWMSWCAINLLWSQMQWRLLSRYSFWSIFNKYASLSTLQGDSCRGYYPLFAQICKLCCAMCRNVLFKSKQ